MKIAFIGLGNMGSQMARNLIKAGHSLTVYNRTVKRAEALESEGAKVASTPTQAVADAEVLITMLADDAAVEEVLFEPGDAIQTLHEGATHISMSTISVALSKRLADAHQKRGQHYLAATVLGRPDAAEAGKLFIIAAGEPEQIRQCQPLFDVLGQKTFVVGNNAPAANVFKLAANFLITATIEGLAESCAFVRKHDLDQNVFLEFLTGSLFTAPVYRNYGGMIAADKFEPVGFKLPLGFKDNRLLLSAADDVAVPMPLANLVHDRFVTALAHGMSNADWSAIAHIAFQEAGLANGE
jgi:3-hydroxyisobutyrate dehydrogenase-like beta-hydroxyacid dehydrogenase